MLRHIEIAVFLWYTVKNKTEKEKIKMANFNLDEIKGMVTSAVKKITEDKTLLDKFKKEPAQTVKSVLNVDLPTDALDKVVDGVKAKINVDNASGILGSIKKLF